MSEPREEIRVVGRKRERLPPGFFLNLGPGAVGSFPPFFRRGPDVAFLAPAAPKVVEEIIVTGKRTAKAARVIPKAPRVSVGALVATVGGFLTAKILEEVSQQQLERAFARWEAIRGRVSPDTPLLVKPTPKKTPPIPEIIVTARRRSPLFRLITGVVLPQPGAPTVPPRRPRRRPAREPRPPGRPRRPRRQPQPKPRRPVIPRVPRIPEVQPATIPRRDPAQVPVAPPATIPGTSPDVFVQPTVRPGIRFVTAPGIFPGAVPTPTPTPGVGISPALGIAANPALTGVGVTVLPFPRRVPTPRLQLQAARRCPPCPRKKEKDKKRNKCFVILTKQRRFKRWDYTRKWREIDCDTGRPI